MKEKLSAAWRYITREHVYEDRWLNTIGSIAGALGIFFFATDLFERLNGALPGNVEFAYYLYITYPTTGLLFCGWVVVYRNWVVQYRNLRSESSAEKTKLVDSLAEQEAGHKRTVSSLEATHASTVASAVSERQVVEHAQHRMAEIVRLYVARLARREEFEPLEGNNELREILDHRVCEYLQAKLNLSGVTVTTKFVVEGKLRAVYRSISDSGKPQRDTEIALDESQVFTAFIARPAESPPKRCVKIRDTEMLSHAESYKAYAKRCGFQSVLAFPLKKPALRETGTNTLSEASQIRGFLSFDAPCANAFDGLFEAVEGEPESVDGSHLSGTPDLEFFFGIADSLATLNVIEEFAARTSPSPELQKPE